MFISQNVGAQKLPNPEKSCFLYLVIRRLGSSCFILVEEQSIAFAPHMHLLAGQPEQAMGTRP